MGFACLGIGLMALGAWIAEMNSGPDWEPLTAAEFRSFINACDGAEAIYDDDQRLVGIQCLTLFDVGGEKTWGPGQVFRHGDSIWKLKPGSRVWPVKGMGAEI